MTEIMRGREEFQDIFAKVKHDALTYTDISEDAFNTTMTRTFSDRKNFINSEKHVQCSQSQNATENTHT